MASLRKAINAKCKECIWDPISGKNGHLAQIKACTSYSCPLYPVRPMPLVKTANSPSKTTISVDASEVVV